MWAPGGPQIVSPRHEYLDGSKSTHEEGSKEAKCENPK